MLSDWIKVYEDEVPESFCDDCLDFFNTVDVQNTNFNWRRCQINSKIDTNTVLFEKLKAIIKKCLNRYKVETENKTLHFVNTIEAPNIIRYQPNDPEGENHFHSHSDNWSMNTASRQLSLIIYLNDVEQGGNTTFTDLNISCKCKKGNILVFPSFYLFTHKGEAPISNDKYILVSWLHFDGNKHAYRVHKLNK